MAYTSWSVVYGEVPSAAKWNILGANDASFNDGTGIFGLYKNLLAVDSNPYKFRVYRNAAWTDGNAAFAKVSFDTEVFDTNNNFSGGTYTAPVNGFYQFSGSIQKTVTSGNFALTAIYVNSAEHSRFGQYITSNTNVQTQTMAALIQLTAGNTVDVYSYGTGGAGGTGGVYTFFCGFLVSRT